MRGRVFLFSFVCLGLGGGVRAETRFFMFLQPSYIQAYLNARIPWEKEIEPKTLGLLVDAGVLKVTELTLSKWSDRNRVSCDIKFDFTPKGLSSGTLVSGAAHISSGIEYRRHGSGGEFYLVRPIIEGLVIEQYGSLREAALRVAINLWLSRRFKAKPFFVLNMENFFPRVVHSFLQRLIFIENHLVAYLNMSDSEWTEFVDIGQWAENLPFKGVWVMVNGPLGASSPRPSGIDPPLRFRLPPR